MGGKTCGGCRSHMAKGAWKNGPPCHFKPCESSELMLTELDIWMEFYYKVQTPLIRESGAGADALNLAGVWDDEAIDMLTVLDAMRITKEREDEELRRRNG